MGGLHLLISLFVVPIACDWQEGSSMWSQRCSFFLCVPRQTPAFRLTRPQLRCFSTDDVNDLDCFQIMGFKVRTKYSEWKARFDSIRFHSISSNSIVSQPSFVISLTDLKTNYKQLMSNLHPDRHTLKSTNEQEHFRHLASQVTRAYSILRTPHERALHLIQLAGKPMEESSTVR